MLSSLWLLLVAAHWLTGEGKGEFVALSLRLCLIWWGKLEKEENLAEYSLA
jgi:hypothetical protein